MKIVFIFSPPSVWNNVAWGGDTHCLTVNFVKIKQLLNHFEKTTNNSLTFFTNMRICRFYDFYPRKLSIFGFGTK